MRWRRWLAGLVLWQLLLLVAAAVIHAEDWGSMLQGCASQEQAAPRCCGWHPAKPTPAAVNQSTSGQQGCCRVCIDGRCTVNKICCHTEAEVEHAAALPRRISHAHHARTVFVFVRPFETLNHIPCVRLMHVLQQQLLLQTAPCDAAAGAPSPAATPASTAAPGVTVQGLIVTRQCINRMSSETINSWFAPPVSSCWSQEPPGAAPAWNNGCQIPPYYDYANVSHQGTGRPPFTAAAQRKIGNSQ
jgi:hypothetical protein